MIVLGAAREMMYHVGCRVGSAFVVVVARALEGENERRKMEFILGEVGRMFSKCRRSLVYEDGGGDDGRYAGHQLSLCFLEKLVSYHPRPSLQLPCQGA